MYAMKNLRGRHEFWLPWCLRPDEYPLRRASASFPGLPLGDRTPTRILRCAGSAGSRAAIIRAGGRVLTGGMSNDESEAFRGIEGGEQQRVLSRAPGERPPGCSRRPPATCERATRESQRCVNNEVGYRSEMATQTSTGRCPASGSIELRPGAGLRRLRNRLPA